MSNENYLIPVLIEDQRLHPLLKRTRSGITQEFQEPGKRGFEADFKILPPLKHVYAELKDGKWFWVNGCDECHGREGTWVTYVKCEAHDICHRCKIQRSKITDRAVWGNPKGFECYSCHDELHEIDKKEALESFNEEDFCERDYEDLDTPKCPYCDFEYSDPHHDFYDSENKQTECPRCDNKFLVTAVPSIAFTTKRVEE